MSDFPYKPESEKDADPAELRSRLANADAELHARGEALLAAASELKRLRDALSSSFDNSVRLCFQLINAFDPLMGNQARAVVDICCKMAKSKYFDEQEKKALIAAGWLYHVGLIGFDRALITKFRAASGSLTAGEMEALRTHPIRGQQLAGFVDNLRSLGETIRWHHEKFNGGGYPDGIAGEAIPWTARCLAVAVDFVESRLPKQQALDAILAESGTSFDPDAVRLFFKMTQADGLPRQVREVMVDELEPGMRLAKGIYSNVGLLLVPEGASLTAATIAKIKNYNLVTTITDRLFILT